MSTWTLPNVLVVGPGGLGGYTYLGTLLCIDKLLLSNITTVCGVSVGAIILLLKISGYTILEIMSEALSTEIFNVNNMAITLSSITKTTGLIKVDVIADRLNRLMTIKYGTIPTLLQLFNYTGIFFETTTVDANSNEGVFLSYKTHPELSCVNAVIRSIIIPGVFDRLVQDGITWLDGALCNPYPVDRYDVEGNTVLGIYIDSYNGKDIANSIEYFSRILNISMGEIRRRVINNCSDRVKHLCLTTPAFNVMGLGVSLADKASMIFKGYNQGKAFIATLSKISIEEAPIIEEHDYIVPKIETPPEYIYINVSKETRDLLPLMDKSNPLSM